MDGAVLSAVRAPPLGCFSDRRSRITRSRASALEAARETVARSAGPPRARVASAPRGCCAPALAPLPQRAWTKLERGYSPPTVHDMLVRLYDIPEPSARVAALHQAAIEVRRALAPERHVVVSWVRQQFGEAWASECEVSF